MAQGLYAAPAVVREYVQNAVDSYVEFAKKIGEKPSNEVRLDVQGNSLHIFDDGIGMGETEIQNAKKIAVSEKPLNTPELYVGFRGIGIWAGLAACKRLVIKSSKYGDPYMHRMTIEFEKIAKEAQKAISIKQLLDPNVRLERADERKELHYTHVELQDITSQYEKLIDPAYLKNILVETCPTQFDPRFKHSADIQKFLEGKGISFFKIFLGGGEIFRSFPEKVNQPNYKVIEVDGSSVAVGWACINSQTGKLSEKELERKNISLRVKNFGVGERGIYAENGERWRQIGFENIDSPQNLDWYAGEVHILDLDNEIIPNTPRTELEDSRQARQFIGKLREYYDELTTDVRVHSEKVNAEKDIEDAKDLVEKLQKVKIDDTLAQDEAFNMEKKVGKSLKDLQDDEKLATRRISKSDSGNKSLQKKIKDALSRKPIREERAMLIGQLERKYRDLRSKLGIKDAEIPDNKTGKSRGSKKNTKVKPFDTTADYVGPKQNVSDLTKEKDAERLLQSIIRVIENVIGVESDDYAKICTQIEELFRKKGML